MAWIELERRSDIQTKTYDFYDESSYDTDGNLKPDAIPYNSITRDEETIWTLVEFDFGVVCNIPHFMPKDEDYIQQSILNREIVEKSKIS